MKGFDPKKAETAFACYGIHGGLTLLLAVCLAAYDGLEHTYPILMGYMLIGWVIPFGLWRFVKRGISRPVAKWRSAIQSAGYKYGIPISFCVGGAVLFFVELFGIGVSDKITVNGEIITKLDPRFTKVQLEWRIIGAAAGLFFIILGYIIFRFFRKQTTNQTNQNYSN
jgi:hypothetical protein